MSKNPFGIGIYKPKFNENIGTLWRSAYQLGASWIFTIEGKYKETKSDTYKTWKQIPLFEYEDIDELLVVKNISLVCIETDDIVKNSIMLPYFKHPAICAYILGNESMGLPQNIIDKCNHFVNIPAMRSQSYNVSMAGTVVMWDRMFKMRFTSETTRGS